MTRVFDAEAVAKLTFEMAGDWAVARIAIAHNGKTGEAVEIARFAPYLVENVEHADAVRLVIANAVYGAIDRVVKAYGEETGLEPAELELLSRRSWNS